MISIHSEYVSRMDIVRLDRVVSFILLDAIEPDDVVVHIARKYFDSCDV